MRRHAMVRHRPPRVIRRWRLREPHIAGIPGELSALKRPHNRVAVTDLATGRDSVGKKIGIDFTKKYLKLFLAVGEIRQTFEIFNHLSIYHNACCCLTMLY